MEEITTTLASASDVSFELARWYHDLARLCVQAAELQMNLSEDSAQEDLDRALALNDVIRIRMATVQSVEGTFREDFPRLYIDHQVEKILTLPEAA